MTCPMQKSKISQCQATEKKDNYKELCSDSMTILYAHALEHQGDISYSSLMALLKKLSN